MRLFFFFTTPFSVFVHIDKASFAFLLLPRFPLRIYSGTRMGIFSEKLKYDIQKLCAREHGAVKSAVENAAYAYRRCVEHVSVFSTHSLSLCMFRCLPLHTSRSFLVCRMIMVNKPIEYA